MHGIDVYRPNSRTHMKGTSRTDPGARRCHYIIPQYHGCFPGFSAGSPVVHRTYRTSNNSSLFSLSLSLSLSLLSLSLSLSSLPLSFSPSSVREPVPWGLGLWVKLWDKYKDCREARACRTASRLHRDTQVLCGTVYHPGHLSEGG